MLTSNPFAELSASVPPVFMKAYVVVMVVLVVAGTLFDILHKKSAMYFFESWGDAKNRGSKRVGGGELVSLAIRTVCVEVATSAEFCTARRRIAHLLTMYGFLAYVITTAVLVFGYPTPATPAPPILPWLWHIGALMVCAGGYWFWFFIRADVAAEGHSPFRVMQADLFILSLLASVTLGLIWSFLQSAGASGWTSVFFALYIIATTVLFGSVPWSKFAHMFFKPAAAFEKRVAEANGSRSKLPARPTSRKCSAARADSLRTTDPPTNPDPPTETHANIRLHDPLRWVRTLRGHLSVRHHAHRQDLSPRLQHRAQHVLGVLLVRQGVSAERHRRTRICRLRAARTQRPGAPGGGEGHDLLADRVPGRAGEELRVPDSTTPWGSIPSPAELAPPSAEAMQSQELAHEPDALNIGFLPALTPDQLKQGVL